MPVRLPPAPAKHDAQNQNDVRRTYMRVAQEILARLAEVERVLASG